MFVNYLRVYKFRGAYYLLSGPDKDIPQSISQMIVGECHGCRQPYLVIQGVEYSSQLLRAIRKDMKQIAEATGFPGKELSIYLCDEETVYCAGCGCELHLPVPELLDADRTSFGRYALWMTAKRRKIK